MQVWTLLFDVCLSHVERGELLIKVSFVSFQNKAGEKGES